MFLLKRNLSYYWRTNLVVVAGVSIAVAVLAGALLVGDSVRASLRNLFLQKLGETSHVINSATFFREKLADEMQADSGFQSSGFNAVCPLIVLEGSVTHASSERRGAGVRVYGVDERFWKFHGRAGVVGPPGEREVLISPRLAQELSAARQDALLLRISMPSAIPVESVHGRKEDAGRTLRLNLREVLSAEAMGEFSISPEQAATRAIFVPLGLLQKELEQEGKVNTLLVSEKKVSGAESLEKILRDRITFADMGMRLRIVDGGLQFALETDSALINDPLAEAARGVAREMNLGSYRVFSYLANSIRAGEREIPYSLVSAYDGAVVVGPPHKLEDPPTIVLNEWAARELGAKEGDEIYLDYYLWQPDGGLVTRSAKFRMTSSMPILGFGSDRDLVPDYPGITASESIADWDPPFPVDLTRIRKQDEDYWREYRTTPKAFIEVKTAQELWGTRYGKLTSLRVARDHRPFIEPLMEEFQKRLKAKLNPAQMGFIVYPARAQGLAASRGATDFGEYFLYFSFFLVVSALMLAALFFRLGVEQRLREIGTLQAIGFPAARVRSLFLKEGLLLSALGSIIGLLLAIAYGKLMMYGLSTFWVGAVGTTNLKLNVSALSLVIGGAGGILAALVCIALTLRGIRRASARSLLHGNLTREQGKAQSTGSRALFSARALTRFPLLPFLLFLLLGLSFMLLAALKVIGQVAGFFGGGTMLLIALLCYQWARLRSGTSGLIAGNGFRSLFRMGLRNASSRPARSILCITLIASAAFIIVAVDAFRKDDVNSSLDKKSGGGGFLLLGESDLPVVYDPNSGAGREALNLQDAEANSLAFTRFRLRPGDDASCLNLYQPRNPRLLGATDDFLASNRFAFQDSVAQTAEEKANPWLLLNREMEPGVVPVIADANSLAYVLHLKLGEDFVLERGGQPLRLRVVAALSDSLFQSELLISEKNFLRYFPEIEGYRFFLVDAQSPDAGGMLEERLSDFGFDAQQVRERLAEFHRVENTYLSTFQMLGGLGLALGTLGLAAVLLRNVLERRRELALLRAVGYNRSHFALMVIGENALLLFSGLVTGTVCALLAIAPVFYARGGKLPFLSLGALLLAVIVSGLVASAAATVAVLRSPLIPSLRAE